MNDIFTRLFDGEIECTSSHARPHLVTYAAGLDLCEVEPSCVTFGDTTFKFDSCLNALFGDIGYVVAFDHGQHVRLYSKDGEPLPTMDDAVSCVFDKQPWQLVEKQQITKTIMDQIQGLEGEVLADKLREIAQAVENSTNGSVNKRQFLKSGSSIVTLRGHVGCLVSTEAVAFPLKYIVRLVNGHELLVSEYDVTFVRRATEHEDEYFLYMRSCYDAVAYSSTCKESDFTDAVSKCAPDIQRQATYWYASGRSIAFGLGGLPEQYKETSLDIMQVVEQKKEPINSNWRSNAVDGRRRRRR